jgi:DNA topoisomerase-1
MNLMIVESPNKTKKIADILSRVQPGVKWQVEASVGHIRDLPASGKNEEWITTGVGTDYRPYYELTEKGKGVAAKLKKIAAEADAVYLATDPDREGESISWHLQQALRLKDPIRVAFNELTDGRIRDALSQARKIDMRLVGAQEARRVADRLVGYLVSPELGRQTGDKLSAGRVQSPATYLVVLKERSIKAFKVTNHFGVELQFAGDKPNELWHAKWDTAPYVSEESPYFMDSRFAGLVAAVRDLKVVGFDEKDASRNPPAPFTTSTLQQAASTALKCNPKKTMSLAQELFAQGHISYHRTDNPNVADDSMAEIRSVAQSMGLEVVAKRREFKIPEGAQAGHSGIAPTHWAVEEAGETAEQVALYRLIRIRAIASQLLAARYKVREAMLEPLDLIEGKSVSFKASGRTLTEAGWLKLMGKDDTDEDDEKDSPNPVPLLQVDQVIQAADGKMVELATRPPKRYTEASLVKALESHGVGRPATFASIMTNIIETRGYIEVDAKRQLKPTALGEKVIARMEGKFSFLDVGYTREMEKSLDMIASGETSYIPVIKKLHEGLEQEIKACLLAVPTFQKVVATYTCPTCKKHQLRRIAKGSNGPFWSCSGYQSEECKASFPDKGGKPVTEKKAPPPVSTSQLCRADGCGKGLIRRPSSKKKGAYWWACSGYPTCKQSYPDKKGKPEYDTTTKEKNA